MARRYNRSNKRLKAKTHGRINRRVNKIGKRRIPSQLSKSKSELFKTEREWIGHKIDQNGIRPLQDKLLATKELKEPKNEKELKSFLGAIQYLSKYIENLSAQTDIFRQLLKKEPNNRGTGPRGPDGRFTKSPRTFNIHDPDSESEDTEPESPVAVTPKKSGTIGRGRHMKLVRNRSSPASPGGSSPTVQSQIFGPMTIVTEHMTTEAVSRAIEDAREADAEIHLKDSSGKVSHNMIKSPKRGEEEND